MTETSPLSQRVLYADPMDLRGLYYDLRGVEMSDGNPGFSPAEVQASTDLLTQNRFLPTKDAGPGGLYVPEGSSIPTEDRIFIMKGPDGSVLGQYTIRVPARIPLVSRRDVITPKILPRLLVDLEEIVTWPGIAYGGACTEGSPLNFQKGSAPFPSRDLVEVPVTCPGPLEITVTETAEAITLGAVQTYVGDVIFKSKFTPFSSL